MLDFHRSVLFISARSPFARRVRLAFIEHAISFDEKVLNVFESNPQLTFLNPLSRVPVLVLHSGENIIDSSYILQAFYANMPVSPLIPALSHETAVDYKWSGIALGLAEVVVALYLESLRPPEMQNPDMLKESELIVETVLANFESFIGDRPFILENHLTQSDLDMGSALDYTLLRFAKDWTKRFPLTFTYLSGLKLRPSFQKTTPPV